MGAHPAEPPPAEPPPAEPPPAEPPPRRGATVAVDGMRRLAVASGLALVLALLLVAALGDPAAAVTPTGSTPRDGEVLSAPPPMVVVQFDNPVIPAFGGLQVTDAAGTRVDTGPVYTTDLTALRVSMPATLPPGAYRAAWQGQGPNGALTQGSISFTVAPPTTPGSTNALRAASIAALVVTGLLLLGEVGLLTLADRDDRRRLMPWLALAAAGCLVITVVLAVLATRA